MGKQGGSQLAQLKSALHSSGLSRQSNPKKRKRDGDRDEATRNRDKKVARLEQITRKLNPFDVKVQRVKMNVAGEKIKGVRGRPGRSHEMGLNQRRNTLLVEYQQRGRAGGIVDRRLGENDPTMSSEDRMLARFAHERQRNTKKDAYNLEDEEELTHYGQSLNTVDDFERTGLALDNDPEEEPVGRTHFGGFDDDEQEEEEDPDAPPRKKSKAEVMAEVMEKSKAHKHDRQVQREADDNLRHQVDQELDSIRDLLFSLPADTLKQPSTSTDAMATTGSNAILVVAPSSGPPPQRTDEDYDRTVKELLFEKRAKPTDRMKTEEEMALEEKELLEKAERARIRRMNGEEDFDSDDEGAARSRRKEKERRAPQGDDLEGDFEGEEDEGFLGSGLAGPSEGDTGSDGDMDEDEDEEFGGIKDSSEEDEDGNSDDDSGSSGEESEGSLGGDLSLSEAESETSMTEEPEDLVQPTKPSGSFKGKGKGKGVAKELPFTFPCPETHDEFLDIIADVDDEDIPTVVKRIRALYHPSLGVENKAKLEVFTTILIEHVLYASTTSDDPFTLVASLSPHIFSFTKAYGVAAAKTFISKLVIMQKNLTRGLAQGPTSPDSRTFPGKAELTFLRMIGAVWSTSDMWHPVVTPAQILMAQYLSQCRVRMLKDLASGMFLCTLFLQYQSLSKRIVPEALNFILNTILHLSPYTVTKTAFPSPDLNSEALTSLHIDSAALSTLEPVPANFPCYFRRHPEDSKEDGKINLLALAFNLLDKFAELYGASETFIEMFEPARDVLSKLTTEKYGPTLKALHTRVLDALDRRLKFAKQRRQPLQLQAHKPIAIASIAPKYDPYFSGRKTGQNEFEEEANKLKAMYKKEKKSAVKELRKDARFLAAEKAKQQAQKDREYNEKMARVVGEISSERAEEKQTKRMEGIAKLRAGKRK